MPHRFPQTKGAHSRYGKGPTAAEFKDVMDLFGKKAREVMAKVTNSDPDHLPADYEPIFSYDNTNIHHDAAAVIGEPGTGSHALLPPYSPDMHKVIEHIFNSVSYILFANAIPKLVAKLGSKPTPPPSIFWDKVYEVFFQYGRDHLAGIQKDIESLDKTYRWIIDHGGLRAPHGLN